MGQANAQLPLLVHVYQRALAEAEMLMAFCPGLEPRSALKEVANSNGIMWGQDMGLFVVWAELQLFSGGQR